MSTTFLLSFMGKNEDQDLRVCAKFEAQLSTGPKA